MLAELATQEVVINETYPFGDTVPGCDAVFPKEEFDRHREGVRIEMAKRGIGLLLLTGAENIFYLCGQQSPGYYMFQCLCLPVEGEPFLIVRELEAANARANTYLDNILPYADGTSPPAFLAEELKKRGWRGKRVGVDLSSWFLTVAHHRQLQAGFGDLMDVSGIVEPVRAVKMPLELEQIERSAAATAAGMRAAIDAVKEGASENDVAAAMIQAHYLNGSEYVGMEPFVCSGYRSGLRHATWRRRVLEAGDLVTLENSTCYNRYHSALFRTALVGDKADDRARTMRDTCVEGLEIALENLKPGNTCADVHNAVQRHIDEAGFTGNFRKRAGYTMGIAFAPDWGDKCLSLNHDVHVELVPRCGRRRRC